MGRWGGGEEVGRQRTLLLESFLQALTFSSQKAMPMGLRPPFHIRGCQSEPSSVTLRGSEGLQTP